MSSDIENDVRRRIDETFGLANLSKLSVGISALEADGHMATANVLKALLKQDIEHSQDK